MSLIFTTKLLMNWTFVDVALIVINIPKNAKTQQVVHKFTPSKSSPNTSVQKSTQSSQDFKQNSYEIK